MSIESVMLCSHLILCRTLLLPPNFPSLRVFSMSRLFAQVAKVDASASASVLPMNIQHWFPLGWMLWSPCSPRDPQKSLAPQFESINSFALSLFIALLHMTAGTTIALTRWTFVGKVMSLLFNMLFRLVIAFLQMRKFLLISWLQSPSAVILEPPKIKSATVSTFLHLFAMKWWDWMPWS